jgi:hypothetical protein
MVQILQAIYASNNKGIDVTAIVTSLISQGNDDIPATNESFTDPDPGSGKYFMVWYQVPGLNNSNPIGLACSEGTTIDLVPTSGAPPQYSTAPQPAIAASSITAVVVNRAVYGTPVNGYDVTAICQAIVNQGALVSDQAGTYSIPVNNGTFGGDPNHGTVKSFAMSYTMNGVLSFIGAQEGQTLNLPNSP